MLAPILLPVLPKSPCGYGPFGSYGRNMIRMTLFPASRGFPGESPHQVDEGKTMLISVRKHNHLRDGLAICCSGSVPKSHARLIGVI